MAVNLCKDCKHHLFNQDYKIDYCTRKPYTEPIHGLVKYTHCIDERTGMYGTCTYQAIHWSPK